MVIIMPIMYKLARDAQGSVVVGYGTKEACDEAIRIAASRDNPVLLLTATVGNDGEKAHGRIAEDYIRKMSPSTPTAFSEAPSYNTLGEISGLIRFIAGQREEVERVILAVKWCDARRVRMITRRLFKRNGITCPFTVVEHELVMPWWTTWYELAAYVKDLWLTR